MDAYRIALKLFLDPASAAAIDRRKLVPMFHGWIQRQSLPGHLLIDVADYDHVPNGPGIVLVSHEANLSMDQAEGKLGLLYARKRPLGGGFAQRLSTVVGAALHACSIMEKDPTAGDIHFRTNELSLRLLDRLTAPNTDQTLTSIQLTLKSLLDQLYPDAKGDFTIDRNPDQRLNFQLTIRTASNPTIDEMLHRLADWREPFIH